MCFWNYKWERFNLSIENRRKCFIALLKGNNLDINTIFEEDRLIKKILKRESFFLYLRTHLTMKILFLYHSQKKRGLCYPKV